MPGKQERHTRSKKAQSLSQPSSRASSPVPGPSAEQPPVVVHGSNPEVRQAVLVMDREMTLFTEILEKIEALSRDLKDVKAQTHQFAERLARQEEASGQQVEVTSQQAEVTSQQEGVPNQNVMAGQPNPGEALNLSPRPPREEQGRDGQIARLRRQLEEKERELEEERRRNQARSSQLPAPQLSRREHGTYRDLPQPLPRSRPPTPERVPREHVSGNASAPPFCQPPFGRSTLPLGTAQNVSYVLARESIPHFKGDTSASNPLKKNQEIEGWVRSIENLVKPPTSEAFIQAARANCRGPADLIINSPLFDYMQDWDTFKTALRTKFRGTYTAADFYKVLYENKMSAGQAPMDFYQQLEGSVYQGYRDHKEAIGDPSELIRRVFLSGIPPWLRDFLALKEDCPPSRLAEAAQRVWNSRNGIRHRESTTRHQSPNDLPVGDHLERRHYPDRPPRNRDLYSCPVSTEQDEVMPSHPAPTQWCNFHHSHHHRTSDCRAAAAAAMRATATRSLTCFRCRRIGHLARECPFQIGQNGRAPSPTGSIAAGSRNFNQHTDGVNDQRGECNGFYGKTSRGTQC